MRFLHGSRSVFVLATALALTTGISGQSTVPPTNSAPNPYQTIENWAKMPEGRTWGSTSAVDIDKDGKSIIESKYEKAFGFGEGLALVKLDQRWGFIDKTGQTAIDFKYEEAGEFGEGVAPVKINGKWGYIDKTGKFVIKPQFEDAKTFADGLGEVHIQNHDAYVDHAGAVVWQSED